MDIINCKIGGIAGNMKTKIAVSFHVFRKQLSLISYFACFYGPIYSDMLKLALFCCTFCVFSPKISLFSVEILIIHFFNQPVNKRVFKRWLKLNKFK